MALQRSVEGLYHSPGLGMRGRWPSGLARIGSDNKTQPETEIKMIRQTVRSAALVAAGLLLAGGAWGQVLRQGTSPALTVALEYFGAAQGREIQASKFGDERPYVRLTSSGDSITPGNVADITFALSGATFSQTASPSDLDLREDTCAGNKLPLLVSGPTSGGAKGDPGVTFKVEVASEQEIGPEVALCFWVPDLQATLATISPPGAPRMMGVNVKASIEQGVTNSNPFPKTINGGDIDHDKNATTDEVPGPITDRTIFVAAPALATSLGTGGTGLVDIRDRTKIVASSGTPDPSASPDSAATGLLVGTVSIEAAPGSGAIRKLNGSGFVAPEGVIDASLGGQISLSVGGPFQSGDKVVFGAGSAARQVEPEGGKASNKLELKATAGVTIVYVPGGKGILKPSTFAATAKYSFNNLDNDNDVRITGSTGTIKYAGVNVEGYAYGVVKGGGVDQSYLRVTCEAGGSCSVFADCTDQSGTGYFGALLEDRIPAGATVAVDSAALAKVLDGGWETGRGRCDLYSNASLAVQHMVRSGGVLINNSTVVGRGLDERADAGALASILGSIGDVCDSVGTGDGKQDGVEKDGTTPPTDVDTACMPTDTMPPM